LNNGTSYGTVVRRELVEMVTPSQSINLCDDAQVYTPSLMSTIDLCDEAHGKLNNGTSDGTVVRRELSIPLLDDRSTSVDLVLTHHRVLVTGSLPFSGSSLSGLLFGAVHPVDRIPCLVKTCTSIVPQLSRVYRCQPSWKEHHLSFKTLT
jgi:hypothetical protein